MTMTTLPTVTVERTVTQPPPGWARVVAEVRSSVVRLSVSGCEGTGMGSGFIVGQDLVMTAAHVVDDAVTVTVRNDVGDLVDADVVGLDRSADVALLRTRETLDGKPATLASEDPAQGSDLAILGFPLWAEDLRIADGIVSSLRATADYDDQFVENVFTTNAATNGGNSGGPAINSAGLVIGLVSGGVEWVSDGESRTPVQGINFIVPASEITPRLDAWRGDSGTGTACGEALPEPEEDVHIDMRVEADHPRAEDVAQTLYTHGESINDAQYEAAWAQFTPSMQTAMGGLETWEAGVQTSFWERMSLVRVTGAGDALVAEVWLNTEQSAEYGAKGQTCSLWHLDYTMKQVDGAWLIDKAKALSPPEPC